MLDDPPVAARFDLADAHRRWRDQVERDQQLLDTKHLQQPLWHALPKAGHLCVLPIYGGTPATLDQLVATLALSGIESGFKRVRIANLLQWNVLHALRDAMTTARRTSARFDVVSPSGSSIDLFGRLSPTELASLAVDALRTTSDRQGRRDAAREKQELLAVGSLLEPPVTLARLRDALDIALGGSPSPQSSTFSAAERRNLRDFNATVVGQRRVTADRLGDLHADVRELSAFSLSAQMKPDTIGAGEEKIRAVEVRVGASTDGLEQARELLARALAQAFAGGAAGPEMLVVVGAEHLANEVLDTLTGTAEHQGKQLVLVFSQITPSAERTLGYAGSSFAIFLRLPNHADATVASEFLGREYKFVVNGISIADGQTEDWSEAYGMSTSTSRSTGSSSSRTSGYSGFALNCGRSVGTSVTRGFESGQSTTNSAGGSRSRTTTQSSGRVHEYVLEPEVFQQLEDQMMFVATGKTVLLASCRHDLRRAPITSRQALVIP